MHVNSRGGPGVILLVRELDLTSFDHVDNTPHKERQFRIALHELPGRVVDRATDVCLPVPFIAGTSQTRFGARRTGLRFLREYSLGLRVINDGERDRKSTSLNSSHGSISYAVFCLKYKNRLGRGHITRRSK